MLSRAVASRTVASRAVAHRIKRGGKEEAAFTRVVIAKKMKAKYVNNDKARALLYIIAPKAVAVPCVVSSLVLDVFGELAVAGKSKDIK